MLDLLLKGGRASTDTPSSCSPGPVSQHLQEYSGFALKEKKTVWCSKSSVALPPVFSPVVLITLIDATSIWLFFPPFLLCSFLIVYCCSVRLLNGV